MKKLLLSIILTTTIPIPFSNFQKERTYQINIPEHLINSYWQIIHNNSDNMKVKDYRDIMGLLENQIQSQARNFYILDSLNKFSKKDSTKKK